MFQIISDLFINAVILVAAISLGNIFLKKIQCSSKNVINKLLLGTLSGILGCVLMIYSVHITPHKIIDFRLIPIIIMAIYCSFPSAITSSFIIGFFRVVYFGLDTSSIAAVIIALLIGVGSSMISRLRIKMSYKWIFSVLLLFVIGSIGFVLFMLDSPIFWIVVISYFLGVAIVSLGLYHLLNSLLAANRAFKKADDESRKDFLTGLFNFRQFDESLNICIKNAKEQNRNFSILFIDIDNFKKVNDVYGHVEGDKVLKNLGHILFNTCRSFDIVSRRGGEEFTVILVDCDLDQAKEVAERIRQSIEKYDNKLESGRSFKITVSIGISSYPETTSDDEKLIQQADEALYQAKLSGKNAIKVAE